MKPSSGECGAKSIRKAQKKLIQHESSIKSFQFHSDAGGFSPSEACMRSGQITATRTLSAAACESELARLTALIYKPQHNPAVSFRVFPRETLAGFKISPPASEFSRFSHRKEPHILHHNAFSGDGFFI